MMEIKLKTEEIIKLSNKNRILKLIEPQNISELTILIQESNEFYIVKDVENVGVEKKIAYGEMKIKQQSGTIIDDTYIAYFGNEPKLENVLKNVGIHMVMPDK